MLESIWMACFVAALATSYVVFIKQEGGIFTPVVSVGLWILVAFGATNIEHETSCCISTYSVEPLVWFGGFLALMSFVALLLAIFGVWRSEPGDDTDAAPGEQPSINEQINMGN